jgi:hypothetical protein
MRPRYPLHVTHYAPGLRNGGNSWCGRAVGFHAALPATTSAERVTCKACLASMRRYAREYPERAAKLVGPGA